MINLKQRESVDFFFCLLFSKKEFIICRSSDRELFLFLSLVFNGI